MHSHFTSQITSAASIKWQESHTAQLLTCLQRQFHNCRWDCVQVTAVSFQKLHWLLLTDNLADWHRLSKCTRFTAATGVYGHHANMQQVTARQILDAIAVR